MSAPTVRQVVDHPPSVPAEVRAALSLDRTMRRQLVHKHAVEAVAVTDALKLDDAGTRSWVAAMYPRAAALFTDALDPTFARYDHSMVVEVARQAGLVVMHSWLGSPETDATILDRLDLEVHDPLLLGPMTGPTTVHCHTLVTEQRMRGERLQRSVATTTLYVEDIPAVSVGTVCTPVPKEKYANIRRMARERVPAAPAVPDVPTLVDPALIGRTGSDNVLITHPVLDLDAGSWRCQVHVDTTHPVYFEHHIGHVPGIVTMESLAQAARASVALAHPDLDPARVLVRRVAYRFGGWGEHDHPLEASVRLGDRTDVAEDRVAIPLEVGLSQFGQDLVSGTVVLELCRRG